MITIVSNKKNIKSKEINFRFEGVFEGKSVFLNSPENVEILEVLAYTHFLENGTDKVSVEFSVPICNVSVGDSVHISAPSYGVPLPDSKDLFVVSSVVREFSELSALCKITAVRYDF